jgi:flavin-dependent dehydrogenase
MVNNQKYDVAIVGGGLAGLCLAIQCAEQKLNVVLYEKEEYPFHKVCGEYISLESWNFLERIGLNLSSLNLPLIKKLKLSDCSGKTYSFNLPLGGFGISRYFLDNSLFQLAIAKGVKVYTNTRVNDIKYANNDFVVTSTVGSVAAKVVTGAFGKRSNLDIKWNRQFIKQKPNALNNYVGIKYHIKYNHPVDEIVLHNFYNGYCGMSKIEEDKSCLCYLTTAENLKSARNSIKEMEKKTLFKNPEIESIFERAEFLYKEPIAISQVSFSKKNQVENNVILTGDAAGMISPLCGNGMSMAMNASKIAFEEIKIFLSNEVSRQEMEKGYTAKWQKEFSTRLLVGRNVQRLFGGTFTTSVFLKVMQIFPGLATSIIKTTHGKPF